MAVRLGGGTIREIRTLLDLGAIGSWTDRQLLAYLPAGGEDGEAALRVLIHRHAPMVMGVCRRVLGDEAAAEDAFQATFLVLVRKADSLRGHEMITNWMYGVALRTARKERAKTARRQHVERQAAAKRAEWPAEELEKAELRSVIDEELGMLAERYRLPVVLCYLEGMRHEEIAQKLGCPVGTVESRLSRAREKLRARLTRRGLSPTASALAAFLRAPDTAAPFSLSAATSRTLEAATKLSASRAALATPMRWLIARALSLTPGIKTAAVLSTLLVCAAALSAPRISAFVARRQPTPANADDKTPPAGQGPPIADILSDAGGEVLRSELVAALVGPSPKNAGAQGKTQVSGSPAQAKAEVGDWNQERSGQIPTFVAGPAVDDTAKPSRAAVAYAPPLSGIKIDGKLDDWPVAIARYSINRLLISQGIGTSGLVGANLSTSADLSAAFSIGYDPTEQLLYVGVVVRDDKTVLGHSSPTDTDSLEIYVDGLKSERRERQSITPEEFNALELANVPVQQYIAIPGKGMIYGVKQATNPILIAGSLKKTRTQMAYTTNGDVTTYEWAIQVFDQYPDKPTRLEPGKRIGFDISVVDRDKPQSISTAADSSAWIFWNPLWRGIKVMDAGALGEVILME